MIFRDCARFAPPDELPFDGCVIECIEHGIQPVAEIDEDVDEFGCGGSPSGRCPVEGCGEWSQAWDGS